MAGPLSVGRGRFSMPVAGAFGGNDRQRFETGARRCILLSLDS